MESKENEKEKNEIIKIRNTDMERDNKGIDKTTHKKGPYVFISEKRIIWKRDPETGKFYSVKNDGSLWESPTLEDAEAMGPLLDRLRDYDRGK